MVAPRPNGAIWPKILKNVQNGPGGTKWVFLEFSVTSFNTDGWRTVKNHDSAENIIGKLIDYTFLWSEHVFIMFGPKHDIFAKLAQILQKP